MTWPTDDLTSTHLDAGTDDPSLARAELLALLTKVQAMLGALTAGSTPWHSANDGTGSTLDADLLDGHHYSEITTALTDLETDLTAYVDGQGFLTRVSLGTLNTTGSATLGELTNIPSGCERLELVGRGVSGSGIGLISVELGDASGYAAASGGGFLMSTAAGTMSSGAIATTGPLYIISPAAGADQATGRAILSKQQGSHVWIMDSLFFTSNGAAYRNIMSGGYIDNGATAVDRVKVTINSGTFDAGAIDVYAWV